MVANPTAVLEMCLATEGYGAAVLADAPSFYARCNELAAASLLSNSATVSPVAAGTLPAGLTQVGGTTMAQRSNVCEGDLSVSLDGTTGYLYQATALLVGNLASLSMSFECWVKPSALGAGTRTIFAVAGGGATPFTNPGIGYELRWNGGANKYEFGRSYNSGGAYTLSSVQFTGPAVGSWGHIMCTYNVSTGAVVIYLNGSSTATAVFDTNQSGTETSGLYVGAQAGGAAQFWAGNVDEIAIYYNRVISAARTLAHYNASVWTDVSTDWRQPYTLSYGMSGGLPTDRVAGIGEFKFLLNNSSNNSAHTSGYYSPDSGSVRSGFAVGIPVRMSLVSGGTTYYKFRGKLASIQPQAGQFASARATQCVATDFMEDITSQPLQALPTFTSQKEDYLLARVIQAMGTSPHAVSFTTGSDTYTYAFDTQQDETMTAMSEAQRLAQSEFGYIYVKGDTTGGGTLRSESRSSRGAIASAVTLTNAMAATESALAVSRALTVTFNRIRLTNHPRKVDVSNVVLYSMNGSQLIGPNTTITVNGPYRDPNQQAARVGGIAMVTPVSSTDYTGNSASDGSGTDLTSLLTVTATYGSNTAYLTVTNGSADTPLYLTKLQCRGIGIYDYDNQIVPADDTTSQRLYGIRRLAIDLPYQSDATIAAGAAQWILSYWKTPPTYIPSVTFPANQSSTVMGYALSVEPGDRITLVETQTGLNADFFVQGVRLAGTPVNLDCTWMLAPQTVGRMWILGTSGASELDSTTVLGYA